MCYHRCVMKRYNKFYNVSLGNFLKVACCSLSIITIASCAEEPWEEDGNSESDLQKAASNLRTALKNSGSDISITYLDDVKSLNLQTAKDVHKQLDKIENNNSIPDYVKRFAKKLSSQLETIYGFKAEPKLNKAEEWKLNIAKEWKKVEEVVDNLITKYKSLGMIDNFCDPLISFKNMGKRLCVDDSDGELSGLKYILTDLDSDKKNKVFEDNAEVIMLINNVESVIKDFFNKFDKSEPAGVSPFQAEPKLTKEQQLAKLEKAIHKLSIRDKSFQQNGGANWDQVDRIRETGKELLHDGSANKLENFKMALNDLVSIKNNFENNEDVLDLINKIEYESNAFINKFYKSKPAVDSKVSQ